MSTARWRASLCCSLGISPTHHRSPSCKLPRQLWLCSVPVCVSWWSFPTIYDIQSSRDMYICLSRRRRHCALLQPFYARMRRECASSLLWSTISLLPSGAEGFPAARLWSIFWWLITFQSFLDNYFYRPFKQIAPQSFTHTQLHTHIPKSEVYTASKRELRYGWPLFVSSCGLIFDLLYEENT